MFQKISGKALKIAIILLVIFFVLIGLILGIEKYKFWRGTKEVEKLAENLKKIEELDYKLAMADTYGGKTPQETLEMFISAVEKGDYELASKYFVIAKQKEEKNDLKNLLESQDEKSIKFKSEFLEMLKQLQPEENSSTDNTFRMKTKTKMGPYFFVRFLKYPNGIWKIIEI